MQLIGKKMARLPVKPRMAKSLWKAIEYNCVYEIIVIAAMLEQKNQWKTKKKLFSWMSKIWTETDFGCIPLANPNGTEYYSVIQQIFMYMWYILQ